VPSIKVLTSQEVEQSFNPPSGRRLRAEEMLPYVEAVSKLNKQHPGGIVELEEGDEPRKVMMRLHRAARDRGVNLRFRRQGQESQHLVFRLQTEEETKRLKARGQQLAQSRQAKGSSRGKQG
jgi:hypothetical protein